MNRVQAEQGRGGEERLELGSQSITAVVTAEIAHGASTLFLETLLCPSEAGVSLSIWGDCIFQKMAMTPSPIPHDLLEPSHCPTTEWGLILPLLSLSGLQIHAGRDP